MYISGYNKAGAMSDNVRQLQLEDGNFDFLPQAILRGSIERIEKTNRIEFSHHEDDLDGFDAAVLMIEPALESSRFTKTGAHDPLTVDFVTHSELLRAHGSGLPLVFMLQRYDREPRDKITIFLPREAASRDEISKSIRRILHTLHIEASALVWERKDAPEL